MPVCRPAMPTEPAGTRTRGVARRGAAIGCVDRAQVGEARQEPEHEDAIVVPACARRRRRRRCRPANAATAARSGPSSPPYDTGISTVVPAAQRPATRLARCSSASRDARRRRRSSGSKYTATTGRWARRRARQAGRARAYGRRSRDRARVDRWVDDLLRARAAAPSRPRHESRYVRFTRERLQQLAVDAAEAAVGHQHDEVAGAVLARRCLDDVVDRRECAGRACPAPQIVARAARPTAARPPAASSGRPARRPPRRRAPNARAKSSWKTRRHDDADRGSKTAQIRRPGYRRAQRRPASRRPRSDGARSRRRP